jgi:hypothetical protein
VSSHDPRYGSAPYRRRPSSPATAGAIIIGTWVVAAGFVLAVAAGTRVGPVVVKLTTTHGIHLGDLCTALGAGGVAILVTVWVIANYRWR